MDFVLPNGAKVASPVVVRVAGLPVVAVQRLRFERSFAHVCAVVRLRARLNTEAEALSDELYAVIGTSSDGADKSALVGLRRAVFQVRMPTGREWNERIARGLPADIAVRLRNWISTLSQCERLSARLPETLARETAAKQAALRDIVAHSGFQRALSQASPALFGETAKWLADETRVPRRRSVIRLAKYVARAAAKTSPYSTFTISGAGTWSESGPSVRFGEPTPAVGILELNGFLLAGLNNALRDDPRLFPALPLRLNPSATRIDDTIRFLGPSAHESIVTMSATPAVLECLQVLEGGARYSRGDLRDLLGGGDPADRRVDRFLAHLVAAGLLERQLPVADLAADPLDQLAGWLAGNGAVEFAGIVAAVRRVRSRLRHPAPVNDVADHGARQRALGAAIDELAELTGLPARRLVDRDVDLWHENAVFTGPVGEFSAAGWRPALADLDVVRRMLAALDPALPLRVALGAYCAERFGPGSEVPFLTLHETIARDLTCNTAQDRGNAAEEIARLLPATGAAAGSFLGGSRLARLRELVRIREDLRRVILAPADADGIIRADPDAVARLAATWPRWAAAPQSMTCYLQLIRDEESLRLVVNAAHGGHGRGRTRALHLIRQAGGRVPHDPAWGVTASDPASGTTTGVPALAEVGGMFGFSPNVRLPSVPYEIDYPFTVSGRPAEQRIAVGDLAVVHDPGTGLVSLFANGLKSEVKALHLGMMADALLPPAARLLAQAFGCAYLVYANLPLLTPPQAVSAPDTVLSFARVEVGRVVVRRARWVAPVEQVPARRKGESDADYLLRIVGWLVAHSIPARCFVRMSADRVTTDPATPQRLSKSRKPVYVDFANWYLVQAFERMLAGSGPVVIFEEVLPAPRDALGPDPSQPSVTEFIVEISAPAAGHG